MRRVWRITFQKADGKSIDVDSEYITEAMDLAVEYLTHRGWTYTVNDIVDVKKIAEPIEVCCHIDNNMEKQS